MPSESLHPEDDEDDMCAEEGQTPSLEDRWDVRKSDVPSSIGSRIFEVRESPLRIDILCIDSCRCVDGGVLGFRACYA